MKKYVFSLLMCVSGLATQAQVTQLPDGFTSGKTVWIVRAGASLNGVSGDGVDATKDGWEKQKPNNKWSGSGEFKRALGGNFSIGFNKLFGSGPVYWGMELGVTMRGYKTEANWSYSSVQQVAGTSSLASHIKRQTNILKAYNVQLVPINVGYKYMLNEKIAIDVHVGGFASYDFAGSFDADLFDVSSSGSAKYGYNTTDKSNSNTTNIGDLDGYRNYDFGVIGGVGFWFGHFNVDLGYQRGFVSIFEGDNTFFCDKLQVRLGYAF